MPRPANCPALVRLVRDRTTASKVVSPAPLAMMPKVKETARYPSPIGIPSFNPALIEFVINTDSYSLLKPSIRNL